MKRKLALLCIQFLGYKEREIQENKEQKVWRKDDQEAFNSYWGRSIFCHVPYWIRKFGGLL